MNEWEPRPGSPVHQRGLLQKALFFGLILGPAVAGCVAVIRLCLTDDDPLIIATYVITATCVTVSCFFGIDFIAYHALCQISVAPAGLIYRGGGVFWKRRMVPQRFPWADYVWETIVAKNTYISLFVTDIKEYEAHQGRSLGASPALSLYPHMSAMNDFHVFVAEIRKYKPDVKLKLMPDPGQH